MRTLEDAYDRPAQVRTPAQSPQYILNAVHEELGKIEDRFAGMEADLFDRYRNVFGMELLPPKNDTSGPKEITPQTLAQSFQQRFDNINRRISEVQAAINAAARAY